MQIGGSGEISIRTRREDNQTVVEISTTAQGIAPENISRIFEPFFTTKGVGSGKGLGLTISQGIVGDRHGGEIEVESKAGGDTLHRAIAGPSDRAKRYPGGARG